MTYSPEHLGYIIHPSAKDLEFQHRVALINDINTIQLALKKEKMNTEQFDYMWDQPTEILVRFVQDQSSLLSPHYL